MEEGTFLPQPYGQLTEVIKLAATNNPRPSGGGFSFAFCDPYNQKENN